MEKECFYTEEDGHARIRKYLAWLIESGERDILFYIADLRSLDNVASGELQFLSNLRRNPHKIIVNGSSIELITDKSIPSFGRTRPLIAYIPRDIELRKLHGINDVTKMIVIPWVTDEIKEWIEYSGATKFGEQKVVKETKLSKVVINALNDMSDAINIANSMIHPRNKEVVIDTFQKLKDGKEPYDPSEVRKWIISQVGWKPEDAQVVYEIVSKIKSGKKMRTTHWANFWGNNIINEWRKVTDD